MHKQILNLIKPASGQAFIHYTSVEFVQWKVLLYFTFCRTYVYVPFHIENIIYEFTCITAQDGSKNI